jgi:hypothetical protein
VPKKEKNKNKMAKFYTVKKDNDGIVDVGTMRVLITFSRAPGTPAELKEYLEDIEHIYSKNRNFLILYDALSVNKCPSKEVLQHLADYMNSREDDTKRLTFACAIVIDSSSILGIGLLTLVKSILFVRKPACPTKFFGKMEEAQIFLRTFNPDKK